jgi:SNF2 family DNA or RNA helicase
LLSLKAGGVGLNLTAASYVFLLDPWWNPAAEAQAYDRAHRMGQKNQVFVYKFISRKSIEEKIIQLQKEKLQLFDTMVNGDADIMKNLSVEDVMKLLE